MCLGLFPGRGRRLILDHRRRNCGVISWYLGVDGGMWEGLTCHLGRAIVPTGVVCLGLLVELGLVVGEREGFGGGHGNVRASKGRRASNNDVVFETW